MAMQRSGGGIGMKHHRSLHLLRIIATKNA